MHSVSTMNGHLAASPHLRKKAVESPLCQSLPHQLMPPHNMVTTVRQLYHYHVQGWPRLPPHRVLQSLLILAGTRFHSVYHGLPRIDKVRERPG